MSSEEKIREIEDAGFRVEIVHARAQKIINRGREQRIVPHECGGWTRCTVGAAVKPGPQEKVVDTLIAEGRAHCHPRDRFVRRIGFDIAVGRAYKAWRHFMETPR